MNEPYELHSARGNPMNRRAWMRTALVAIIASSGRARADEPEEAANQEANEVEARGKKAGLKPFQYSRSQHFTAIGDAGSGFRELTLRDYELIRVDYLEGYKTLGFDVSSPSRRLTLVALADDRSFAAFKGEPGLRREPKVGGAKVGSAQLEGYYQRRSNLLILFDHEAAPRPAAFTAPEVR